MILSNMSVTCSCWKTFICLTVGAHLRLIGAGVIQEKALLFAQDLEGAIIPTCWECRRRTAAIGSEISVSFNRRSYGSSMSGAQRGKAWSWESVVAAIARRSRLGKATSLYTMLRNNRRLLSMAMAGSQIEVTANLFNQAYDAGEI